MSTDPSTSRQPSPTDEQIRSRFQTDPATWLRYQYHEHRKSTREIADRLNVTPACIQQRMEVHGIERRSSAEAIRLRSERE